MKETNDLLKSLLAIHVMHIASELQVAHDVSQRGQPMRGISINEYELNSKGVLPRAEALRQAAELVKEQVPIVLKHLGLPP